MKYERPEYLDPSVKTEDVSILFGAATTMVPVFDTPITPRENFRRAITRQDPVWMPNSLTDVQNIMTNDVMGHKVRGMQVHSSLDTRATEDYRFLDWFGADWTWCCSAGGAMLTPGTMVLSDITKWESELKWPDLTEWGFEEKAEWFMKNVYDPKKALKYDIGRGMTERLVSLVGGYTEGMLALAVEPEAVADFFDRNAQFIIDTFDYMNNLYPLDMVNMHDDWGTERDTFFSETMLEELVFEPTKRIFDHIKSKGVMVELHSCGNVTRFFPYMPKLGADVAQVQRRAVDMPLMRKKYGDEIGFCAGVEGVEFGAEVSSEEYCQKARESVDLYAPGGGSYISVFTNDPKTRWDACAEIYCHSRELYDKEREARAQKV